MKKDDLKIVSKTYFEILDTELEKTKKFYKGDTAVLDYFVSTLKNEIKKRFW